MTRTLAAMAIALGALVGTAATASAHDPFTQIDFPCQEDEVLGYAPQFGPDHVGCIPVEDFLR